MRVSMSSLLAFDENRRPRCRAETAMGVAVAGDENDGQGRPRVIRAFVQVLSRSCRHAHVEDQAAP